MMNISARTDQRLAEAGFKTATVAEFLGMTPEESTLVEMHVALSNAIVERRKAAGLTQTQLAEKIGSSQSRVAMLEMGAKATLDHLFKTLLALGAGPDDLAAIIAGASAMAGGPATK